jgi:hypothetical protein
MFARPRPPPARPEKSSAAEGFSAPRREPRTDRWRRYRERLRAGLMVPSMPGIGADEVEFLIATRWLDERDAADRREVGAAIAAMLKASARRR